MPVGPTNLTPGLVDALLAGVSALWLMGETAAVAGATVEPLNH